MTRLLKPIYWAAGFICIVTAVFYFLRFVPGQSYHGALPALHDRQLQMAKRLASHVGVLAGEIGERQYLRVGSLERAAAYIENQLQLAGLIPYTQEFGDEFEYRNVIAEHYGSQTPDEIIIVGAHYDTVRFTPGADDNASGVAAMIEMARLLCQRKFARTIRFVAFANEEYPFFFTEDMGSLVHAKRAREKDETIVAMFSLEMLGYFSDEPNSQSYPRPLQWIYPDTANFIAFVSDINSRKLLHDAIGIFRAHAQFPSEALVAPAALVPDIKRSDHAAFWEYGYPAVMITDTAGFRNAGYHNIDDVPESLNYGKMALVVDGLLVMLATLAGPVSADAGQSSLDHITGDLNFGRLIK